MAVAGSRTGNIVILWVGAYTETGRNASKCLLRPSIMVLCGCAAHENNVYASRNRLAFVRLG